MDIRKVKKLIELLNESGIGEIEVTEGEESVRISKEIKSTKIPSNDSHLEKTSASKTIKEEPSLAKSDTSNDDGYEVWHRWLEHFTLHQNQEHRHMFRLAIMLIKETLFVLLKL